MTTTLLAPPAPVPPCVFTNTFGRYAGPGSTIESDVDGFRVVATLYADDDIGAPWERDDGHGPVSGWTTRGKAAGERVLREDRRSRRYYDFAEAVRIARRDGWGYPGQVDGETAGQRAARAAEHDFKVLRAWCNDEWFYVGVAVRVWRDGEPVTGEYDHALWGVESNYPGGDNSYLSEVAEECAGEALIAARAVLAEWSESDDTRL